MFIVDAHLDLAYNAMRGRDVLRPAAHQTPDDEGTPAVGLPDLRIGGVQLVCGTVFAEPASRRNGQHGYNTPAEAHEMGWRQLQWYRQQARAGEISIVTSADEVPPHQSGQASPSVIILLEGADPVISPAQLRDWFDAGLRIVALAWRATRYAGGTGAPGPLTDDGIELVKEIDRLKMIHDISHLAEESFWQLLDSSAGPVMASHSNCRTIVDTDRQLSDATICALAGRGAVIGVNLYERFLVPTGQPARRATLDDAIAQVRHICDLVGDAAHVGLGSDMDGGFGRERIPVEINSSADLPRLAERLGASGFSDSDVRAVMGGNWAGFFRRNLRAVGEQ